MAAFDNLGFAASSATLSKIGAALTLGASSIDVAIPRVLQYCDADDPPAEPHATISTCGPGTTTFDCKSVA